MSEPSKAVFLSYASQDAEVAKKICEALRSSGVEVWFDQSELRGGDSWDQKIRKQIKECALFVPIISANTQARAEGYFRLEWKLADRRTELIGKSKAFLLPICIDDTREAEADVPDSFLTVQWMRIGSADSLDAFCERVRKLLSGEVGARAASPARPDPVGGTPALPAKKSRWLVPAVAAVAIVATAAFALRNGFTPQPEIQPALRSPGEGGNAEHSTAAVRSASSGQAPTSEARQLVSRVYAAKVDSAEMTRAKFEAMERLCQRAATLDPTDAEVWAAWAYLESWLVQQFDRRSPERFESARTKAARAASYAPYAFNTRLAQAAYFTLVAPPQSNLTRAESILKGLLQEQPDHPGALRLMVHVCRGGSFAAGTTERRAEEFLFLDRLERVAGYAATACSMRGHGLRGRGELAAAKEQAERSVALGGGSPAVLLQILLCQEWDGDLERARVLADQMPPELLLEDDGAVRAASVYRWRREPGRVLQLLRALNRDWLFANNYTGPKAMLTGEAYLADQKPEAARNDFQFALKQVEERLREAPSNDHLLDLKGQLLEYLGDGAGAAEARRLLAQVTGSPLVATRRSPAERLADLESRLTDGRAIRVGRAFARRPGALEDSILTAATLRYSPELDDIRTEPAFAGLLQRAEADPRLSPKARPAAGP